MTEYIYSILKKYYGYDTFRNRQEDIIKNIIKGTDVLAVMPTGAGKSICYQIPAIAMDGIALVISPLISLMKDQVWSLNQIGVRAAYLNSSLSYNQFRKAIENAKNGVYKIIYVAPERLFTEVFLDFAVNAGISLLAIDEAHCISQWGHDFRPSYTKIHEFVRLLPKRPVIAAFTATATNQVRDDIAKQLHLKDFFYVNTGFDRKNLYFAVERPVDKKAYILKYLQKNKGKSGIIYCSTRKQVQEVYDFLSENGYETGIYHGGMEDADRNINQDNFIYDRVKVIVATSAFGMGIDKPNVAFVLHYGLPLNIEEYYQQAGRAGRDGEDADCILLYSGGDVMINRFLIEKGIETSHSGTEEEKKILINRELEKLKLMTYYCSIEGCLRKYILGYFGEEAGNKCSNCSKCRTKYAIDVITKECKDFLVAVFKTGERFGINMIADFLMGKENPKLESRGLDLISEFGVLNSKTKEEIKKYSEWLEENGYIFITNDEFRIIKLTSKGENQIQKKSAKIINSIKSKIFDVKDNRYDTNLEENLKKYRQGVASKLGRPAYVIFNDSTLRELVTYRPESYEQLYYIKGLGHSKIEKYGQDIINIVNCSNG